MRFLVLVLAATGFGAVSVASLQTAFPEHKASVVAAVGAAGARVFVEKPSGRDLTSARELNRILIATFQEPAIFRIDHYQGKLPVHNVLYFRFANSFLEPFWNRTRPDHHGRGFRNPGPRRIL